MNRALVAVSAASVMAIAGCGGERGQTEAEAFTQEVVAIQDELAQAGSAEVHVLNGAVTVVYNGVTTEIDRPLVSSTIGGDGLPAVVGYDGEKDVPGAPFAILPLAAMDVVTIRVYGCTPEGVFSDTCTTTSTVDIHEAPDNVEGTVFVDSNGNLVATQVFTPNEPNTVVEWASEA